MQCYYCEKEIPKGTGIRRILKNGASFVYCSHKCMVNHIKNKREGFKQKWTVAYKRRKQEELRQKNKKL